MKEECKWGKPTYTVDGKNIVMIQGFKEYFALGFFQGAFAHLHGGFGLMQVRHGSLVIGFGAEFIGLKGLGAYSAGLDPG